jgi:O-antigen/teichoic acid export membrane protein
VCAVSSAAHATATRAARNAAVRAGAEIVGKLASLVLVVVLAREVGVEGLGVYVFALAWAEVAVTPVDMGFDRLLVRRIAEDRAATDDLFFNLFAIKLGRAVPVAAASFLLLLALGYGPHTRAAVMLALLALLLNSLCWTAISLFTAHERGGLSAITIVAQRVIAAALGVGALALGYDEVAVLGTFAAANAAGLLVALALVASRVGLPRLHLSREGRRRLRRDSWAFAGREVLSIGIARVDALLLSFLATAAAVGLYGASYRLFEATLFIPVALVSALAAMFTYLQVDGDPPVGAVFSRAVKLALVLLCPIAAAFVVLATPLVELFYGEEFTDAAWPLRLLGPTAVLLGVGMLAGSLVVARADPRAMLRVYGIALAVNITANLALIPVLEETGAALGMLVTEVVFCAGALLLASATVGRPPVARTLAAPLGATAAMVAAMVPLAGTLALALLAGVVVYAAVAWTVERRVAPDDLTFIQTLVLRR